ncbi:hypothetical protein RZS08_11060 [Arthrospira platensis SPKY1]|nr:hypothetical protein [Arthrospira platensis SPKY1]
MNNHADGDAQKAHQADAPTLQSSNTEKPKSTHGGPGRGQGRKPLYGESPASRVNVTLDEETIKQAKAMGAGNLSAGLREAVRIAQARTEPHNAKLSGRHEA